MAPLFWPTSPPPQPPPLAMATFPLACEPVIVEFVSFNPTRPPMLLLPAPLTLPVANDDEIVGVPPPEPLCPLRPTSPPSRANVPPVTFPLAKAWLIDPRLLPISPPAMPLLPTLTVPLAQENDPPAQLPDGALVLTRLPRFVPRRPPAAVVMDPAVPFAVEVTAPEARPFVMVAPALFQPMRPPIETPSPVAFTAFLALRLASEALLSPIKP